MQEISQPELTVCLPAYQEAENLDFLLPKILVVLKQLGLTYQVLVIDANPSKDNTADVCMKYEDVQYVSRTEGNAYGDAIRTAISQAYGKYVLFMDADGSHTPEFIKELYDHREKGDVIIASRYVTGGQTENTPLLIAMSLIVNVLYALVLQLHCKDVSNSFKLYRREQLVSLNLRCNNFDIVEEIMFKLKKNNKKIRFVELPYTFKKRTFGKTKRNLFLFMFTYVVTIFKLRFGK